MGITIQQLNSPNPGRPSYQLQQGQVAMSTLETIPQIYLANNGTQIQPCWVSETQPTPGASQGGLWFKPSSNTLYIGIDSEYKPFWPYLFGCTTADSTSLGAWQGGSLTGVGPKYFTSISNNNPKGDFIGECKGVFIGLTDRNPLNAGGDLTFVSINGQDHYNGRLPDNSVTINNSGGSARGDGAVRIGYRAGTIEVATQTISEGTYVAVGKSAGYNTGIFGDFTTMGLESGEYIRPVTQGQSSVTLLGGPKGASTPSLKRPLEDVAWIGDGNTFVPDDVTGRNVAFSKIAHLGWDNDPASDTMIIGGKFKVSFPAQTRSTVICNGTFAPNNSFGQVVMGGYSSGGSLNTTSVGLCNGLGVCMFSVSDGGLRFKDNPTQSPGQVLTSQGSSAPPKWVTLPDGFFVDSRRREVTIKGGFIVNITNPV